MARRNPYAGVGDLLPSEQELEAQRRATAAPGESAAWGSGIGTLLGGVAGGLLSIPSGGSLAPVLIPAGMGAGGALGGAVGGAVGNSQADAAGKTLDAAALRRQRQLQQLQEHQDALDALMGTK